MASPPSEGNRLTAVSVAIIIFVLSLPLSKLNGLAPYPCSGVTEVEERKLMILGSRPPQCVNKCFSCRPCTATLVIPPHHSESKSIRSNLVASSPSSLLAKQDDDTYYLLSWKCRCGNKIYHP
ncbi:EPIDERMAL PATTERNING FACTOR-like protein 2 [Papaver somniferum]|uniref:EPIDERMAL PATTERNING FACTOR-like protein 2 n=1 Tax=Papaver somniferum TaxID=3469 RepID=UPI000E700B4A|nr:EPIDERMAL PATTERNING FACTOR-like protein 2 [Papaver somniferum]